MSSESPASKVMIGTYELVRRLGVGGMGEVWLARQRGAAGFARDVAIKRLLPQAMEQPDVVNMFIEEAQITGRLRHPNVVNVIELGAAESGELYLVLEHVDGTGLHKLLRDAENRPSIGAALAIGREVALALNAAHSLTDDEGKDLGLVHRDVTPSNVMIDKLGHVKLMDFGIAKVRAKSNQTETGIIKGKIAYLAPEQLRGDVDPRSDIFALGLVVWEIAAGKQARGGSSDAVMMAKVALDEIPSIKIHLPDLPPAVIAAIDKAVALDPDARYQTGDEMAAAMLVALEALPTRNKMEAAREELATLVRAAVKRDGETAAGSTSSGRTKNADRPLAITLHSLVVQQGDLTISRPLSADMLKVRPPTDARTSSGTRVGRKKRSSALPLVALGASAVLLVGVLALRKSRRAPVVAVNAIDNPSRASADAGAAANPNAIPVVVAVVTDSGTQPSAPVQPVAATTGANAAGSAPAHSGPRGTHGSQSGAHATAHPAAGAGTAVAPNTPASLRVSVRPWGNVRIDGRDYGTTPISPISLPPGSHSVVVVNNERQADRTFRIQLAPGESRLLQVDLTTAL